MNALPHETPAMPRNAHPARHLAAAVLLALLPLAGGTATPPLHDLDGAEITAQLQAGRLTSEALVQALLARIAVLDDAGRASTRSRTSMPMRWNRPACSTPSAAPAGCAVRCTACRYC